MENLIAWSAQFLNRDKTFIDIGEPLFTPIYNNCKDVSSTFNNNVCFVKIFSTDILTILKLNEEELKNSRYPAILFKFTDQMLLRYLSSLGYQIMSINGYQNIMLAADNSQTSTFNFDDTEKLILDTQTSSSLRNQLIIKIYDYMKPLPYTKKINLNVPSPLNRSAMNPSIINIKNGYLCNIRYANYVYDPDFKFLDNGSIHLSDHYYIYFDKDFNIKRSFIIKDETNNIYHDSFVKGVDDLRIINESLFLCSHGNFNNHRTINQCLGHVNDGKIDKLIPLIGPERYRHEKNWLPFIKNETLYVIYMIHPFTLYSVNHDDGSLTLIKQLKLTDKNLDNIRGSATCIPYKDGWLATCHHVSNMCYLHRFIYFDDNFDTLSISKPFYFEIKGIEFNAGMCNYDDGVILAVSIRDKDPKLLFINNSTINDLFYNTI